jgi:hypothetical protein
MKVGTEMIGDWGAMIPLSYGKITKFDLFDVFIAWDDMPGSVRYKYSDINVGQGGGVGIGVYTKEFYMFPDGVTK